jgi:hypothetical protein
VGAAAAAMIAEPQALQKRDPSGFSWPFGQRTILVSSGDRAVLRRQHRPRSVSGQPSCWGRSVGGLVPVRVEERDFELGS